MEEQKGMMGSQGMPMCGMMGDGMKMSAHIDERLGAIRSELKITQGQSQSWDAYANALRASAANMDKLHAEMMAGRAGAMHLSPIERLDRHDRMLAAARNNIRALRPALARFYASLSAEQKRKADTLLLPHGGMMQQMPMGETMRK